MSSRATALFVDPGSRGLLSASEDPHGSIHEERESRRARILVSWAMGARALMGLGSEQECPEESGGVVLVWCSFRPIFHIYKGYTRV